MTAGGVAAGYWAGGGWSCEDGGPRRPQTVAGELGARERPLEVTSRLCPAATMVVHRDPGETYLLRHTAGDDAISFVERIDPDSLDPVERSPDLAGGATWPGSVAVHADGSLVVVFGRHAHVLGPDCSVLASRQLPRDRPYNGFVVLDDGVVVTKDFAGSRPGHPVPSADRERCELLALAPGTLEVVHRLVLPEPSIARLSADGTDVYVVGDTSLLRVRWDGATFRLDDGFDARYRIRPGQAYGWDCVIAGGFAWFLDDGEGTETYTGTLRGHGVSTAPLQLVRVDLASGAVDAAEVSGLPGGLVANPPVVDTDRGIAVGYDSGNGVVAAFETDTLEVRWRREQDHGAHLVLFEGSGEVVCGDHDPAAGEHLVVLDVETGEEVSRVATGSPVQSVLFPSVAADGAVYSCSFTTVTRVVTS